MRRTKLTSCIGYHTNRTRKRATYYDRLEARHRTTIHVSAFIELEFSTGDIVTYELTRKLNAYETRPPRHVRKPVPTLCILDDLKRYFGTDAERIWHELVADSQNTKQEAQ